MATKESTSDWQQPEETPDVTIALAELGEETDHLVSPVAATEEKVVVAGLPAPSEKSSETDPQAEENQAAAQPVTAPDAAPAKDIAPGEVQGGALTETVAAESASGEAGELSRQSVASATAAPAKAVNVSVVEEEESLNEGLVISTPSSRKREKPQPRAGATRSDKSLRFSLPILLVAVIVLSASMFGLGYWYGASSASADPSAAAQAEQEARIKELQNSLAEKPDQPKARLELGLLLFNSGKVKEAKTQWLEVTKLDEKNIEAWYNLGFCYLSEDPPNKEAAKKAWEKVVEIDPKSAPAQTVQNHLDMLIDGAMAKELEAGNNPHAGTEFGGAGSAENGSDSGAAGAGQADGKKDSSATGDK